tara:strand:- start:4 stop:186 length:183 start_codon:yes stop_codon:yes gene_type:complete
MNILAMIPARMSSRFPGKPMKKILGKPIPTRKYEKVEMKKQVRMLPTSFNTHALDTAQDL